LVGLRWREGWRRAVDLPVPLFADFPAEPDRRDFVLDAGRFPFPDAGFFLRSVIA
jgi:hypothetical protein